MKSISVCCLIAVVLVAGPLYAQGVGDSLTLQDVVRLTLLNQPVILQAEQNLAAAEARVGVSRAALSPELTVLADLTRIGPVATFDFDNQSLDLAPRNVYDAHLELNQNLYDFGKKRMTVEAAEGMHRTASDQIDQARLILAYQTVAAFNSVLILRNTIVVIDSQLAALQKHAAVSTKKIQAGTATTYDTLTTQVRIAVATNDRNDAERALNSQFIVLRQLTGLPDNQPLNLTGDFATVNPTPSYDSLMSAAATQRPDMILAMDAEKAAQIQARIAGVGSRPTLSLKATSGVKNGYEPRLNQPKVNFTAGLSFKMPLFNGHKTRYEETAARANVEAAQEHTADVRRQVVSDVQQALLNVQSALRKLSTADIQIRQAELAMTMAGTRYEAGVITNLELLDVQTTLLQTRLIRLRALYDYTVGLAALDRATGRKIW